MLAACQVTLLPVRTWNVQNASQDAVTVPNCAVRQTYPH